MQIGQRFGVIFLFETCDPRGVATRDGAAGVAHDNDNGRGITKITEPVRGAIDICKGQVGHEFSGAVTEGVGRIELQWFCNGSRRARYDFRRLLVGLLRSAVIACSERDQKSTGDDAVHGRCRGVRVYAGTGAADTR